MSMGKLSGGYHLYCLVVCCSPFEVNTQTLDARPTSRCQESTIVGLGRVSPCVVSRGPSSALSPASLNGHHVEGPRLGSVHHFKNPPFNHETLGPETTNPTSSGACVTVNSGLLFVRSPCSSITDTWIGLLQQATGPRGFGGAVGLTFRFHFLASIVSRAA